MNERPSRPHSRRYAPLVRDDQRRTERGVGYEERLSFSLMKESIKVMKGVRRHNGVDCL